MVKRLDIRNTARTLLNNGDSVRETQRQAILPFGKHHWPYWHKPGQLWHQWSVSENIHHMCGPSLTTTSLDGTWQYSNHLYYCSQCTLTQHWPSDWGQSQQVAQTGSCGVPLTGEQMQPYFQCASYKSFPNLRETKILMQVSAVKHFHVLNVTMHSLQRRSQTSLATKWRGCEIVAE